MAYLISSKTIVLLITLISILSKETIQIDLKNNQAVEEALNIIDSSFLSLLKYKHRNLDDTNQCVQLWKAIYEKIKEDDILDDNVDVIMKTYNSNILNKLIEILKSRSTVYKDNSLILYLMNCTEELSDDRYNNILKTSESSSDNNDELSIKRLRNLEDEYKKGEEKINSYKEYTDKLNGCQKDFNDCLKIAENKCLIEITQLNRDIDLAKSSYDNLRGEVEQLTNESNIKSKKIIKLKQTIKSVQLESEKYKQSANLYEQKLKEKNLI